MSETVQTFTTTLLAVFAALFPIVNPLGAAPIFLEFSRGASPPARVALARRVALGGFVLLLVSMVLGSHILSFFGITLPVLRVAGGMVVTYVGWTILHKGDQPQERTPAPEVRWRHIETQAFYPLTMPLTVGPGSMATAIALGAQKKVHEPTGVFAAEVLAAVLGLMAVALSIYLAFRYADAIERALGRSGTNVLVRLFAFILLCIGVQIVWTGVSGLIATLPIRV